MGEAGKPAGLRMGQVDRGKRNDGVRVGGTAGGRRARTPVGKGIFKGLEVFQVIGVLRVFEVIKSLWGLTVLKGLQSLPALRGLKGH